MSTTPRPTRPPPAQGARSACRWRSALLPRLPLLLRLPVGLALGYGDLMAAAGTPRPVGGSAEPLRHGSRT